jgi:hypothetical protein
MDLLAVIGCNDGDGLKSLVGTLSRSCLSLQMTEENTKRGERSENTFVCSFFGSFPRHLLHRKSHQNAKKCSRLVHCYGQHCGVYDPRPAS